MSEPAPRPHGPRLIDLTALVAGYGLAALLMRALWPATRELPGAQAVVAGVLFLWLGLAMGGPILLLLDQSQEAREQPSGPRRSWAEWAWMMIGCYWIFLAVLVVPSRLRVDPLLGVLPILFVIIVRLLVPRRREPRPETTSWTHTTAIGLIVTWPVAWGALILLGKTLF